MGSKGLTKEIIVQKAVAADRRKRPVGHFPA